MRYKKNKPQFDSLVEGGYFQPLVIMNRSAVNIY